MALDYNQDPLLENAQSITDKLNHLKQYDKARDTLEGLRGNRSRPNLALQLITMNTREDSTDLLAKAINQAEGEIERTYKDLQMMVR